LKKILGAILLTGVVLVGCGGGGEDSVSVFDEHSRSYECYKSNGAYAGQYSMKFSAASATVITGGVSVTASAKGQTDTGGYKYADLVPSGRVIAVILEPSNDPYKVAFGYSFVGVALLDESTMRVCR
jgi:hypothetical protein